MLAPDDRATLLSELQPPPGFVIEHLVATTFTLDLESALLPCLALAGSARAETADTVETVAAIRSTIGAVDIFHQNGQIAVPRAATRLFSLLEDAIHGITPNRGLFHPKIWLGVYANDTGDELLKLIVATRNLTRDRSWDVMLTLDGWFETSPSAQNRPLADLLRYLAGAATTPLGNERRQRLEQLAEEIRYARWERPAGVRAIDFHLFGLPGRTQPKPDFSGYRHLLVTPFIEDAGLERLATGARGKVVVVSRQEGLDGLSEAMADWIDDSYVLSPTAGIPTDDDDDDEAGAGRTLFTGLHAKLYVIERARMARMFIGSANATRSAFEHNVEILVELTATTTVYGVERVLGEHGFGSLLDKTDISVGTVEPDDPQHALDTYLRSIAAVPITGRLTPSDDDRVDLRVTSVDPVPAADADVSMTIALLTDPSTESALTPALPLAVDYLDLALADVTAFVVITVRDGAGRSSATVVKACLVGDLPARLDRVVTTEMSDPEAFRRFLALILSFGHLGESDGRQPGASGSGGTWATSESGLFEQLMRASVARPEVLDRLAGVVAAIIKDGDPHEVLPPGFSDLWSAIDTATAERRTGDG